MIAAGRAGAPGLRPVRRESRRHADVRRIRPRDRPRAV